MTSPVCWRSSCSSSTCRGGRGAQPGRHLRRLCSGSAGRITLRCGVSGHSTGQPASTAPSADMKPRWRRSYNSQSRLSCRVSLRVQRVDLGAPREGERRDVFAECPFVHACPSRGATAGLPALGARRDRHAFGACLDLPFDEAKMTTCLKKRPSMRASRARCSGVIDIRTALPGQRGNAVPSGA